MLQRLKQRWMPREGSRLRIVVDGFVYLAGREATILISSIAFSFMVSIFPFIILLLTLAQYLNWQELRETIFATFYSFFPISQEFIIRNLKIYTERLGALHIVSFLLMAWGVSAFFFSLEAGLDSAYRVPRYRRFYRSQILGTAMAIGVGAVGFGFIALFRALQIAGREWAALDAGQLALVSDVSSLAFGLLMTLLTFYAIFHWLPNRRHGLREIWPEVVFSSGLWLLGNWVFRASVPLLSLQQIYGPFYISITLLLWALGSACIILLTARLSTDGLLRRRSAGKKVPEPEPDDLELEDARPPSAAVAEQPRA